MIEALQLTKRFDDITAVDHVDARIKEGTVFGLIGTNGAGKSTFLKLMAGILKPDGGSILLDGEAVYENPGAKGKLVYISDDQYYLSNETPSGLSRFYQRIYPGFDKARCKELLESFGLDPARKINTFSKGMKKQLSVILGLCANTPYLLCDEAFDGLDPVMRQAVKSLFAQDMEDRGLTPVIASHGLRELEDICDHVGLLHRGGILFSKDLDDMKLNIHKLQCVLKPGMDAGDLKELNIIHTERSGSFFTFTVRGSQDEILARMQVYDPVFFEIVPLSLEEIFICETEVTGYDIKKLIL